MELDFKKITIIGVGLIGGSIALALKEKNNRIEIIGVGRTLANLEKAKKQGLIDYYYSSPENDAVNESDLIIIATPVGIIPQIVSMIEPYITSEAIITDVGSSKSMILNRIDKLKSSKIMFVGSHPMAGSEKKGIEFSRSDMFLNSTCFVTKNKHTNPFALNKIKLLWSTLGASVTEVSPEEHDEIVALTSHLPHIIATLQSIMTRDKCKNKENELKIKAGIGNGFRDITRIAASDPVMWKDICISNKKYILKQINELRLELFKIETLIQMEDSEGLLQKFSDAKEFRDKI
ncbi:MAG: prephenate dehydrogenase/arogenate dehydrogenase family protein [Candidatus Firestonebacteria bacterium]|nr:prephenate dehydrogenase/arogenate dehydrogenase family protein [Candidatus Firestonebacteria bacterium]